MIENIEYEVIDSDFWGRKPEKVTHVLRKDVANGFMELCMLALDGLQVAYSSQYEAKIVKNHVIAGKKVFAAMELSKHFGACQIVFRTRKSDRRATPEKFMAYCLYAVSTEFGGHSTCVYDEVGGWLECEVALKKAAVAHIVAFVEDVEYVPY